MHGAIETLVLEEEITGNEEKREWFCGEEDDEDSLYREEIER